MSNKKQRTRRGGCSLVWKSCSCPLRVRYLRFSILFSGPSDDLRRAAHGNAIIRHVLRDDAAGADNGVFADGHAGQYVDFGRDPQLSATNSSFSLTPIFHSPMDERNDLCTGTEI